MKAILFFRSLGFAGLIGAGVSGYIYILFRDSLKDVSVHTFMAIGACLCGGLHQFVDAALVRVFLWPLARYSAYYVKLLHLKILRDYIPPNDRAAIVRRMTNELFFPENEVSPQTEPAIDR